MNLPGILAEIAEVAGEPAALAIVAARAGTSVWIPAEIDAGHWLTDIVGLEAAQAIAAHFRVLNPDGRAAGFRFTVPLGTQGAWKRARRLLVEALQSGMEPAEAARVSGLHERTAFRMQARLRDRRNSAQGELF